MGTPREVSHDAIVVETRDVATATIVTVRILLHPDARFRIDKERLRSLDGMIGQRAIVSAHWEDAVHDLRRRVDVDVSPARALRAERTALPGRRILCVLAINLVVERHHVDPTALQLWDEHPEGERSAPPSSARNLGPARWIAALVRTDVESSPGDCMPTQA